MGDLMLSEVKPFYGWRVLGAATVGLALGYSNIGAASFGLFILPLSETFGWGRGDISVALLLMNATLVVAAPLAGVLIDRVGVRRVLIPSIVMFAFAFAALSLLQGNILVFYITYILVTALGIGTAPASYMRAIIAWFDRRRGLAIGISMAGIGIGATLLPPLVQYLVTNHGWRSGYLVLAGLGLFVALPVVAIWLKEKPEDMGQLADGGATNNEKVEEQSWPGYEFKQCLHQRSFWLMIVGFPLLGMFTSGLMAHLVPLLQDRDVSPALAALGASLLGISLIVGRIFCGLLLDRYPARYVVIGFLLGPVIGLAGLASGASHGYAFASVILIGLAIGAELDFMTYLVSRYLGFMSFGRTYGIMYSAFAVGAGFGPILMGYGQQNTGSYTFALWVLCGATALAIIPFSCLGAYPQVASEGNETNTRSSTPQTA